jgi:hypothetical protein
MTGERSTALRMMVNVAQRRAQTVLREKATSYSVQASYDPLTADQVHIGLAADALQANAASTGSTFLKVIDELAAGGPTEEELQQYVEGIEREHEDPEAPLVWLEFAVGNELLGGHSLDSQTWFQELHALSTESGAAALREALKTELVMAPSELEKPPARFVTAAQWSDRAVSGLSYGLRLGLSPTGRNIRLTLAESGITFGFDQHRLITVWFDRVAGMLTWSDGSRTLYGTDAFRIHLCPSDWKNGPAIIRWLDRHVPEELKVSMGDRPDPDPGMLVHEPKYGFATDYLIAIVAGLWVLDSLAVFLLISGSGNAGLSIPILFLSVTTLRFTLNLWVRLRSPRVRQV